MANRLETLRRIQAVQARMARLSEWSVAAAERTCRDLEADQRRLRDYVVADGSPGVSLAKAALKSLHAVDHRLAEAERERDQRKARCDQLQRREHVVARMTKSAAEAARRHEEDRKLSFTIEAWFAAKAQACRKARGSWC